MVKYDTLNKVWIIILIVAGILFISYFFFGLNIITEVKNIPSKISKSYTEKTTLNDDYCKDNIITETITFKETFEMEYGTIYYNKFISSWKDGTTISYFEVSDRYSTLCKKGNKQGENINYLYCDPFEYSKTDVNGDVIGETIEYSVKLVLDRESIGIEELGEMLRDKAVTFKVVDYNCFKV